MTDEEMADKYVSSQKKYMTANIVKIQIVDGKDTGLHIDKPVYAIHLTDVREMDK